MVVMDTCKWPESCEIRFWTPCTSTLEPLLAVLEDQGAQVQLDICGPFVCSNPTQFKLRLLPPLRCLCDTWGLWLLKAEASYLFLFFSSWNVIWLIDFGVTVRGITLEWPAMETFFAGAKRNLQRLVTAALSVSDAKNKRRGISASLIEEINISSKVKAV